MSPKAIHITYWTITILFALFMLMAGVVEAIQHESGKEIMTHLGYPFHALTVLGIGKILGAIGIIQNKSRVLKEWAYAGFTFTFIGAFAARFSAHDDIGLIISPFIFLAFMFASYFLWKKVETLANTKNIA